MVSAATSKTTTSPVDHRAWVALLHAENDVQKQLIRIEIYRVAHYEMYQALDGARRRRGTIEFDTTETVINFTDDKRIESIRPSVRNDAHKIIEECMISANVCAAKKKPFSGQTWAAVPPKAVGAFM